MDGYGWMDMDGWIWMHGYGDIDMDVWIRMDGWIFSCGQMPSDTFMQFMDNSRTTQIRHTLSLELHESTPPDTASLKHHIRIYIYIYTSLHLRTPKRSFAAR